MSEQGNFGDEAQRQAWLRQLLQAAPDEASCQACLKALDAYIEAQRAGEDYLTRFAETAVHLDACSDCAGAYARLYELAEAEASAALPLPETIPAPDLTFLQSRPGAARQRVDDLVEHLRSALQRAGDALRLPFSPELLDLMRPLPTASLARETAEGRFDEVLLKLELIEGLLPLMVTVYRDTAHPAYCLVEVTVQPEGRYWPQLAGSIVRLSVAGETRQAITDAWGLASFPNVPISSLPDATLEVSLA